MLVYGERPQAQRTKARKDVAQAAALMDYLRTHDTEEMGALWIDVNRPGPGGFTPPNDACSVAKWNAALAAMKKNGTFKTLFLKYYPDRNLPGPEITKF